MTEASENDFKVWMTETARHFEWYADSTLPKPGREPRRLIGAMRYAVLGGGKRDARASGLRRRRRFRREPRGA